MREVLASREGKKSVFYGTFERYGWKSFMGHRARTLLLVNVLDKDLKPVTDHLWFTNTKGFKELDLKQGDIVKFTGRVSPYYRHGEEKDFKLSYPKDLCKVEPETMRRHGQQTLD